MSLGRDEKTYQCATCTHFVLVYWDISNLEIVKGESRLMAFRGWRKDAQQPVTKTFNLGANVAVSIV